MSSAKWVLLIVSIIIVILVILYFLIRKHMRKSSKKSRVKALQNGTCYATLQQCQASCTSVPCSSTYPNGSCPAGKVCTNGTCVCSTPCAQGQECGTDGCGESCGTCPAGKVCQNGKCTCTPDCAGKTCGDDGCGGSCGTCNNGDSCVDGACYAQGWSCSGTSACQQNCQISRPAGCPYPGTEPQFLTGVPSGTYTLQYQNAGYLTVFTNGGSTMALFAPSSTPVVWTYDSEAGTLSATIGGISYMLAARNTNLGENCASSNTGLTDLVGAVTSPVGMPVSFVLGSNFVYSSDAQLFLKAAVPAAVTYSLTQSDASGWIVTPS